MYELPQSVTINGTEYPIRSDYRAILDICMALGDPELTDSERATVLLDIFYYDALPLGYWEEGVKECLRFINLGKDETEGSTVKLMDWEQDFQYIVAPINHVIGQEIRAMNYLHWWTFISAYYEMGDCLFAQIVRIRQKLKKGQKLDDYEKKFYKENRDMVDLKTKLTESESEMFKKWGV